MMTTTTKHQTPLTTTMQSPSPHQPTTASSIQQQQATINSPPSQPNYVVQNLPKYHTPTRNVRPIPGIKYFAVGTMIIAFLLAVLGLIAIILEAWDSYLGNPIWTALLFVLPTGILGIMSYWKKTSFCLNVSFLVMSSISCVACFQLMVYASVNASRENNWYCGPKLRFDYYDYNDCDHDESGRISVDALIAVLALTQLILCTLSVSFTCYATFECCYYCCQSTPTAVVQYFPQNETCQLVSVGAYQSPTGYQPVSLMVPVGSQNGQMISSALPVMAQTQQFQQQHQFQPHQVLIPTQNMAAMMPTPPLQTVVEEPSTPPPVSEKTIMTDPLNVGGLPPEDSLSYGQTATDYFHEERNLLSEQA